MIRTLAVALTTALTLAATPAEAQPPVNGCRAIIHHGMHPTYGEETVYATEQASRWGFGGEVDVRVLADGVLGSGHDDRAGRVTGGVDRRRWSEMTLADFRGVVLAKGGRPALMAEMVAAAARSQGELMLTINGYTEFRELYQRDGFQRIWDTIVRHNMQTRVYVGGFGGVRPYLAEHFPQMRLFRRIYPDEAMPTVEQARAAHTSLLLIAGNGGRANRFLVDYYRRGAIRVGHHQLYLNQAADLAEFRDAYNAGIRLFQVDYGAGLARTCGAML